MLLEGQKSGKRRKAEKRWRKRLRVIFCGGRSEIETALGHRTDPPRRGCQPKPESPELAAQEKGPE
jgi:hypothetical protein